MPINSTEKLPRQTLETMRNLAEKIQGDSKNVPLKLNEEETRLIAFIRFASNEIFSSTFETRQSIRIANGQNGFRRNRRFTRRHVQQLKIFSATVPSQTFVFEIKTNFLTFSFFRNRRSDYALCRFFMFQEVSFSFVTTRRLKLFWFFSYPGMNYHERNKSSSNDSSTSLRLVFGKTSTNSFRFFRLKKSFCFPSSFV